MTFAPLSVASYAIVLFPACYCFAIMFMYHTTSTSSRFPLFPHCNITSHPLGIYFYIYGGVLFLVTHAVNNINTIEYAAHFFTTLYKMGLALISDPICQMKIEHMHVQKSRYCPAHVWVRAPVAIGPGPEGDLDRVRPCPAGMPVLNFVFLQLRGLRAATLDRTSLVRAYLATQVGGQADCGGMMTGKLTVTCRRLTGRDQDS
jgi:hypothetical protein